MMCSKMIMTDSSEFLVRGITRKDDCLPSMNGRTLCIDCQQYSLMWTLTAGFAEHQSPHHALISNPTLLRSIGAQDTGAA
eukprot:COSAG01_NODE_4209_length_5240_cov_1.801595_4_plen_80_part_00